MTASRNLGIPSRRRRVVVVTAACTPNPAPGTTRVSIVSTRRSFSLVARARGDDRDGDTPPVSPEDDERDFDDADDADDANDASFHETDDTYEDEGEEYEEVEVEVDYTPLDHARDAVDSLGTWADVAAWPEEIVGESSSAGAAVDVPSNTNSSFAVQATQPFSASQIGGLSMAPVSGIAVALAFVLGAVFGRSAAETKGNAASGVLVDLAKRASGGSGDNGSFTPMTEEQRIADELKKEKKREEDRLAELARRKKRDEDEAKFVASEKIRMEKERLAEQKAAEAEEKRREKIRAELAERAEIERVYTEERKAAEEAERQRKEAAAAAEFERKREEERITMEARLAKQSAERTRRGETSKSFDVTVSVSFNYRAARGDVEVEVKAKAGISQVSVESGVYNTPAQARIAAQAGCTSVAKQAVTQWASDQRLKLMTGDAGYPEHPLNMEHGGFDDCEFEHWIRVAGARVDQELRALVQRAGAGLEFKIRTPGGGDSNQQASNDTELVIERPSLPLSDPDNVPNRLYASLLAAKDDAFGVATEDLEWVSRFELSQLHGLDGGLCFPAVTESDLNDPDKRLKGKLLATMVTLSHWLSRGRLELLGSVNADPSTSESDPSSKKIYNNCVLLANKMLTTEANAEGASWKAMYLDGFSGDVLTQSAATARAVLEPGDPIREMLELKEEEQKRKLAGVPTIDEEQYPDREESRKARHKQERDSVPLAERLWSMRNAAAQMAVSGSKGQARMMLEEAFQLRSEALAKAQLKQMVESGKKDDSEMKKTQPELLPELCALEDLFASEKAWAKELVGVRVQVLKAVRTASERESKAGNLPRAAALLEGAAREYGGERKLGADHPSSKAAFNAAKEAWDAAGIAESDEDAKSVALAEVAGTPVPRGQGGGIVLRLTKKYLEELEVRRK